MSEWRATVENAPRDLSDDDLTVGPSTNGNIIAKNRSTHGNINIPSFVVVGASAKGGIMLTENTMAADNANVKDVIKGGAIPNNVRASNRTTVHNGEMMVMITGNNAIHSRPVLVDGISGNMVIPFKPKGREKGDHCSLGSDCVPTNGGLLEMVHV